MSTPRPDLMIRVARKWAEAENIAGFELAPLAGETLPPFSAGSHIDVHLPNGMVRQYSLANHPDGAATFEIAVLRDPSSRGGSSCLHDQVEVGDTLPISAPRNHFPLDETAPRSLLVARGIGITPLLSMAARLHHLGRPFELHYVARTPARLAYATRLRRDFPERTIHLYHDESEKAFDLTEILGGDRLHTHLYVCGGPRFIDSVRQQAQAQAWPTDRVHFEYFANEVVHNPSDGSFDVVLNGSGQVIRVGSEETISDALEREGVSVDVLCMQGVCGTCVTRVLEGGIDHRDMYFSPEEQAANDQITLCCSRATGNRLVLDL